MPQTKATIAFVHASAGAIAPLNKYYKQEAPEIRTINLLDDGILELFKEGDENTALRRLAEMICSAKEVYGVSLTMLTCSAVTPPMLAQLREEVGLPVLKIDQPMAREAVRRGSKIGLVVTFQPTLPVAKDFLMESAREAGSDLEIVEEVLPDAYPALLSGDVVRHDRAVIAACERLDRNSVDVIVLAQVSMARILDEVKQRVRAPVLSSLDTSLRAVFEIIRRG